jgi:hypothetical protein
MSNKRSVHLVQRLKRKGLYAEVQFYDGDRSGSDSICLAIKVNGRIVAQGPLEPLSSMAELKRRVKAFNRLYATERGDQGNDSKR